MQNNYTNFHTHCNLCDGRASMADFVRKAIDLKFHSYGISSHSPLPFSSYWNMNLDDMDEYRRQFEELKAKYSNQIHLYLGMEVDYIRNLMSTESSWIMEANLDYRIGSIHYIGQLDNGSYWTVDGDRSEFDRGVDEMFGGDFVKAVKYYFSLVKEMVCKKGVDIIGHFDKIAVQNKPNHCFSDGDWYNNEIREVLNLCKEQNVIVEINTKSIYRKGIYFPDKLHWKIMKEIENSVMINADTHELDLIALGYVEAYQLFYDYGFREVALLTPNGWNMVPINNTGIIC